MVLIYIERMRKYFIQNLVFVHHTIFKEGLLGFFLDLETTDIVLQWHRYCRQLLRFK